MSAVPAARDTLRILKYLAGHSGPVRVSTIQRDLDLPRSTTYHLLRVMRDEGFVTHAPEHQAYGLSVLVSEIGTSVSRSAGLANLARPIIERLTAETRLPVVAHLGVLHHGDVVYALKISSRGAPAVVTSIGVRLPAHLTATGRAMLAGLPITQVAAIYPSAESLIARHGRTPSMETLHTLLAETRERGWAIEDGDVTPRYASVAAAVLDHNQYPTASVGLTFRTTSVSSVQWDPLGTAVRRAADSLSKRIRGSRVGS